MAAGADTGTPYTNKSDRIRALQLVKRLAAGGTAAYYWTPDGDEYTTKSGELARFKETYSCKAQNPILPPASWEGRNVYFGVYPATHFLKRNERTAANFEIVKDAAGKPTGERRLKLTVAAVNALYVEIDAKDQLTPAEWLPFYTAPDVAAMPRHKATAALKMAQDQAIDVATVADLPTYKARALALMLAAPVPPSAMWDSGGGYQGVWLLEETVTLDAGNWQHMADVIRRWVHLVGGDPAASDLPRLLRLPGYQNRKKKYGPGGKPVVFHTFNLGQTYLLAELEALLPVETIEPQHRTRIYTPPGVAPELGERQAVPRLPKHPAIDAYNAETDLRTLLLECGYTPAPGDRMNRPGGTGRSIQLHPDNTATVYSSEDMLYCGHRITPAHVLCVFWYGGDVAKMYAALAGEPYVNVEARIKEVRSYLHQIDLAQHVPIEKQCAAGYRTRERDLAVADAILEIFAGYNSFEGPLGLRQLRRLTNLGGLATVARALDCLSPWFIRPARAQDADGDVAGEAAHRYVLTCCVDGTPNTEEFLGKGVPSTQHIYGEYRAHDAFNATTTPITPQMLAERAENGEPYATSYTLTAVYRRRLQAALPGAGRAALAVVAALVNAGGELRLGDLVGLGGRSKFTISRTVGRLLELDLVTVDAGAVQLRGDWQAWLEQITELMPTAGSGKRRIVRDAITTIQSCDALEAEHRQESRQLPAWVHKRREQARQQLHRLAPGYRPNGVGRVDKQELFTTGRLVWAQILALGEVKRDEMLRMLGVAGFSAEDIAAGERYGKGAFNHTPEYAAYLAAAAV